MNNSPTPGPKLPRTGPKIPETGPRKRPHPHDRREREKSSRKLLLDPDIRVGTRHRKVNSGTVRSAGYNRDSKVMEVQFANGGVYSYWPVEEDDYNSLRAADSPGRYFNSVIKEKYDGWKNK